MTDRATSGAGTASGRKTVVVVGGGAGGMLAAGRAAEKGARVVLLEKTGRLGQKLLISGKTRCNLTNIKPLEEFIAMYGPNGRFLYSAFHRFFRDDLLALLQRYGCETKVERGGRIFPAGDDARDVMAAFERYLADRHVEIRTGCPVAEIVVEEGRCTGVRIGKTGMKHGAVSPKNDNATQNTGIAARKSGSTAQKPGSAASKAGAVSPPFVPDDAVMMAADKPVSADHRPVAVPHEFIPADAVILAAGGASWPITGSTGDGYAMAAALGHTIVPLRAALVPLIVEEIALAKSMQGVSLRNVRLTAFRGRAGTIDPEAAPESDVGRGIPGKRPRGTVIESRQGEMMITHFGVGGPVTLLMSLAIVDALADGPVSVAIDLKPALGRQQLRDRLQRDLNESGKRGFRRILAGLLPMKMIEPFIDLTGIPADKPAHQITAAERDAVAGLLKSLRFNIRAPLPLTSAIVTAGGVSLKEIDPRTMASRLVGGLHFCGEVMDIDADTGGYNLQAAFSTGFLAGEASAMISYNP
jgi:predicted flavoprotein YhiN